MKEHLNAIIISAAILLATIIYCFGTRYQVTMARQSDYVAVVLEHDRMTGSVWKMEGIMKPPYWRKID
jgi:hypothetical protein